MLKVPWANHIIWGKGAETEAQRREMTWPRAHYLTLGQGLTPVPHPVFSLLPSLMPPRGQNLLHVH